MWWDKVAVAKSILRFEDVFWYGKGVNSFYEKVIVEAEVSYKHFDDYKAKNGTQNIFEVQ